MANAESVKEWKQKEHGKTWNWSTRTECQQACKCGRNGRRPGYAQPGCCYDQVTFPLEFLHFPQSHHRGKKDRDSPPSTYDSGPCRTQLLPPPQHPLLPHTAAPLPTACSPPALPTCSILIQVPSRKAARDSLPLSSVFSCFPLPAPLISSWKPFPFPPGKRLPGLPVSMSIWEGFLGFYARINFSSFCS